MTIAPVSSLSSAAVPLSDLARGAPKPAPTPQDLARAAQQFEAIIIRQLLGPSIEPMMNGGTFGEESAGSGGGSTYGYMLTDMLANSISQGGGLGLANVISRQFNPAASAAPAP